MIYNMQDRESTEVSIDGWMNANNVTHIYSGILFSEKSSDIFEYKDDPGSHATWHKPDIET